MIRHRHSPTLSPADRAHLRVIHEEAHLRRIERLMEAGDYETAMLIDCMEGSSYYPPSPLHNQSDRWEQCELTRVNATRCPDRICFTLPLSAYEQKRCAKYSDLDALDAIESIHEAEREGTVSLSELRKQLLA